MPTSLYQLSPESGLNRYLSEIRRFPIPAPQEEYMLAKRWREHEDATAAQKPVTSHLRLVAKIAMGYRGYGLPEANSFPKAMWDSCKRSSASSLNAASASLLTRCGVSRCT